MILSFFFSFPAYSKLRERTALVIGNSHYEVGLLENPVNDAADIHAVRNAAAEMGFKPFIIAKIERASIHEKIDEILTAVNKIISGNLRARAPVSRWG